MLNEQRTGDFFVFDKRINYQTKDYNGLIKNNGVLEMENTTRIKEMTWFEYARRTDDWFILPVGAVEQHGPHLPLYVDTILAEEFAERIAEQVHGVVAPALSYGYKSKPFSGGGPLFPGTIDLSGRTLQYIIEDILEEAVRDGFKKILIFSAHFENEAFIAEAMDICSRRFGDTVQILLMNWWDPMSPTLIDEVFDTIPFPGWALEHAAVTETSLMMYFAPAMVRAEQIVQRSNAVPEICYKYPIDRNSIPKDGCLASAQSSSAEKGRKIVEDVIRNITDYLKKLDI